MYVFGNIIIDVSVKADESINKVSEMYGCAAILNMGNMNVFVKWHLRNLH